MTKTPAAQTAAQALVNVTVWGPNLMSGSETFHIHKTGCQDTTRGVYKRVGGDSNAMVYKGSNTLVEICDDIYEPENLECESGEFVSDFKVFPCCYK